MRLDLTNYSSCEQFANPKTWIPNSNSSMYFLLEFGICVLEFP